METSDYYYRARMMDSSVGRFVSKDPILYLNLYRYVSNNSMRLKDPSGLSAVPKNELSGMKYLPCFKWVKYAIGLRSIYSLYDMIDRAGKKYKRKWGDSEDGPLKDHMLDKLDDFKHCYGACMITNLLGGDVAFYGQIFHEIYGGFQKGRLVDPIEDTASALEGINIAHSSTSSCMGGCEAYVHSLF